MQEQGCDTSVIAASSSTPPWWELHSTYPHSSWSHLMMNNIPWNPSNNHTSNSSCEEDISISTSFTNAGSNQSGLTAVDSPHHEFVESSASADLLGEPASDSHLWNQVLLTIGSNKDAIRSGQDLCENFLSSLSSKSLVSSDNMFEPSSDCLKKVGNTSDDHTSCNSFSTNIDKQWNHDQFEHSTRLNNLPHMVRNWSIAPPEPYLDSHVTPNTCNISSNSISMDRYLESNAPPTNPNYFPSYSLRAGGISRELGAAQSFKHENEQNGFGYNNMDLKNSALGLEPRYFYGVGVSDQVPNMSHARHFSDVISFGGSMKPAGLQPSNGTLALKGQVAQDRKKLALPDVSPIKGNARGSGPASDQGRKRKSGYNSSDSSFKKPKSEGSSTASSPKAQVPKAKLGERITVLQQIVSPFGKTDTASVLYEAIGYIKFLHEQVQLLSNPYLKSGVNKDLCAWGGLERKDNLEARFDLKSRGLCLVPESCTPEAYRDNSGPDYLTPTYRGCLYR